jgi:hypothetical protein
MSIEKVREYLKQWNRDKDVMEFTVSSATVELAAKAVGVNDGFPSFTSMPFCSSVGYSYLSLFMLTLHSFLINKKAKKSMSNKQLSFAQWQAG